MDERQQGPMMKRTLTLPSFSLSLLALIAFLTPFTSSKADELLYTYDADVVPLDPAAGWFGDSCTAPCQESIEYGHYVTRWPAPGDVFSYGYWISRNGTPPAPPTLWVEWRFRSNHPLGPNFYSCDAGFTVNYIGMSEHVYLYGNAAISQDVASFVLDLALNKFHTYRFESLDGVRYQMSVDGRIFLLGERNKPGNADYLIMSGVAGCPSDQIPNAENAWDFVRYGRVEYGEQIVASDPPAGFVDAREHPVLDRFTVRYESPNYVYLDEITVEVTDGVAPIPLQTRRLDNGPSDIVEIVLDRPIPFNATTRFVFNDGTIEQDIEFTYARGDADGDGFVTVSDFALLQNCFFQESVASSPPCPIADLNKDQIIDQADLAEFVSSIGFRRSPSTAPTNANVP